ncbi:MAG: CarD family transcriptional regulator [Oscillospiraceae bacterium]
MFRTGDLIIYGSNGVCRVAEVGKPKVTVADQEKLYYKLLPVYSTETIYTPVDTTVFMRPVISRKEAEELIAQIPSIRGNVYTNHNIALLKEHYEASIQSHDCEDLIQLIKSVYTKNVNAVQNGKKLGQVDQRYMKRAEDLLHGELAIALGIPRDDIVQYIEDVITACEENQTQHNN